MHKPVCRKYEFRRVQTYLNSARFLCLALDYNFTISRCIKNYRKEGNESFMPFPSATLKSPNLFSVTAEWFDEKEELKIKIYVPDFTPFVF